MSDSTASTCATALRLQRRFTSAGQDVFASVEWERRRAEIRDENGQVIFAQDDCEFPSFWSQLATDVVASRYFAPVADGQREHSVRQLIHRVTRTIADWGLQDGVFASREDAQIFYDELTWLILHQYGTFNSPVWFNVGLYQQYGLRGECCQYYWDARAGRVLQAESAYEYPQASACFIQSIRDDMGAIMDLAASEARVFKFGSGTGTDLSPLRAKGEPLSGGGQASGPVSFMRIYDQVAAVVRSGGKKRRAAKMQSLRVDHPDIVEFIWCKAREERKARILLSHHYDDHFEGDVYNYILFQNSNLSVRVTDDFMQAVESDGLWQTRWVRSGQPARTYKARELLQQMAQAAWECGDPGLQYHDTINRWHTCPQAGPINASNPCSEFMFLDDTACNLASLNLLRFRRQTRNAGLLPLEWDDFAHAVRLFFIAQEILVDRSSYPTEAIARNSHTFRPLGLGYANLGALLMTLGLPYDAEEARAAAALLTAFMTGCAYSTSAELAQVRGPFEGFADNREPMLAVMEQHAQAVGSIPDHWPQDKQHVAGVWQRCLELGRQYGYRNAQATVLAPTGTIAFMMDCDTTGIEPDIALVKYKRLAGGGLLKIVNRSVPAALAALGYDAEQQKAILEYLERHERIEDAPGLRPEHVPVFDCAFHAPGGSRAVRPEGHLLMVAAVQPFLSGAVSKTINVPNRTTPEQIMQVFLDAWKLGLKAVSVYRDGSKAVQPLATKRPTQAAIVAQPQKRRLPDTRRSITHKFEIQGHKGYITVGLYEDGTPGEIFITMAKEGSTIGGLMDAFGIALSVGLQYGVPLEELVRKFVHVRFEPSGFTSNPDIPIAKSIVDYIFRWLGRQFVPGFKEEEDRSRSGSAEPLPASASGRALPQPDGAGGQDQGTTVPSDRLRQVAYYQSDAPACDFCGALTVRSGTCYRCMNCGNSLGCS